jgi:hypothetical protein
MTDEVKPLFLHSDGLKKALLDRDEYFASLPPQSLERALEFQDQIDAVLAGAGAKGNRMLLLQTLMQSKLLELKENLDKLNESIKRLSDI